MTRVALAIAMLFSLGGCASLEAPGETYEITVTENYAAQRFDIVLWNPSGESLCFDVENWPNKYGNGILEHDLSYLKVGDRVIREPDLLDVYCPGCYYRVGPRQRATAFLLFRPAEGVDWEGPDPNRQFFLDIHPIRCGTGRESYVPEQNLYSGAPF